MSSPLPSLSSASPAASASVPSPDSKVSVWRIEARDLIVKNLNQIHQAMRKSKENFYPKEMGVKIKAISEEVFQGNGVSKCVEQSLDELFLIFGPYKELAEKLSFSKEVYFQLVKDNSVGLINKIQQLAIRSLPIFSSNSLEKEDISRNYYLMNEINQILVQFAQNPLMESFAEVGNQIYLGDKLTECAETMKLQGQKEELASRKIAMKSDLMGRFAGNLSICYTLTEKHRQEGSNPFSLAVTQGLQAVFSHPAIEQTIDAFIESKMAKGSLQSTMLTDGERCSFVDYVFTNVIPTFIDSINFEKDCRWVIDVELNDYLGYNKTRIPAGSEPIVLAKKACVKEEKKEKEVDAHSSGSSSSSAPVALETTPSGTKEKKEEEFEDGIVVVTTSSTSHEGQDSFVEVTKDSGSDLD